DRRRLAAAIHADHEQDERLGRAEIEGRSGKRQHLRAAPPEEGPDRVGVGQLLAGERILDLVEELLARAYADVGREQHLLDLADDRWVDLLAAGKQLPEPRDEAGGAGSRQPGREDRRVSSLRGRARGLGRRRLRRRWLREGDDLRGRALFGLGLSLGRARLRRAGWGLASRRPGARRRRGLTTS